MSRASPTRQREGLMGSLIRFFRDGLRILRARCLECGAPARTIGMWLRPGGTFKMYGLLCRRCHDRRPS